MRTVSRDGFEFTVNDLWSTRPPDDPNNFDFWGAYETDRWEPELFPMLSSLLTATSTFVDIGAWVGPVSLIAAELCHRVVAIEPDPVAAEEFRRNAPNCELLEMAVGSTDSEMTLGCKSGGAWGDSMSSMIFNDDEITVPCRTLPTIFESVAIENCALVKMDIEGGEAQILASAGPFLAERSIPLYLSLHAPLLADRSEYVDLVKSGLSDFIVERIPEDFSSLLLFPKST